MRVIIACAGSGGHINPGIAIANVIKKNEPDSEILFLGTKTGMENDLVKKAGYNLEHIRAGRLHRRITLQNIKNVSNALFGIKDAKKIITKFKPDVVIGTGGFICLSVMKAAKKKHIPYILHESNAYPGLSVKLVAQDAAKVLTGFEDAKLRLPKGTNAIFTGTPAKFDMDDMMALNKEECRKIIDAGNKKIVFVTGGSQGAIKFNSVVIDMVKKYRPEDIYFVIAVGKDNYDNAIEYIKDEKDIDKYLKIEKFVYEMDKMYKASDLLITRAGAMTVTELSIARRPAILVPLPTAAENHQFFNAKVMENAGAGKVIEENVLNEDLLYDTIKEMIKDEALLETMGDNAAKLYRPNVEQEIYNEIKSVVK